MSRFLRLLLMPIAASILLAACATGGDVPPTAQASATLLPPSPEQATDTVTPFPTLAPTVTPPATETPCDTSVADYCINTGPFPFSPPIAPPGSSLVDREYPFASTAGATREVHHGVELVNATGTPVLAVYAGNVIHAGDETAVRFSPWAGMYGNLVVIEHDLGGQTIHTLYAHLSIINVLPGQSVQTGEKIGEVGLSGAAIGSHLHFEVRLDAQDYYTTINPELYLPPPTGTGVIAIRLVDGNDAFVHAPLSVQYFPVSGKAFTQAWDLEDYAAELQRTNPWENALLGGLQAGHYRITFLWQGVWQERWVDVQSNMLTRVEFIMK